MNDASEIISCLREKGIIINRHALEYIKEKNIHRKDIETLKTESLFLTKEMLVNHFKKDTVKSLTQKTDETTVEIIDEESRGHTEKIKNKPIDAKKSQHSVIIESPDCDEPHEISSESFTEYFNARYNILKNLLLRRPELKNPISIGRLNKFSQDKDISLIGMVSDIRKSKNDNLILVIEDATGKINALIKKQTNNVEDEIILDDVIGVKGNVSNGFMFVDSVVLADVPLPKQINKVNDSVSAVFLSDLHYGSKHFNTKIESRFLKWIKSDDASAVKYLFLVGDNVEGVGIYPNQESELVVKYIYEQYALFEEFILKIPEHIQIIICPGNHDAVRMAEPQPRLRKELVPRLYEKENVYLTTNPATVNIHAIDCQGINVLMYHGYSFTSIVDVVPYLRQNGLGNPQHVMKYLLKRRHLAPTYGSTIALPEKEDRLAITRLPDIFLTGDLHSYATDNYKGITLISASTFQNQTPFMDRVGHVANPGKVTIVDLSTREVRCIDMNNQ